MANFILMGINECGEEFRVNDTVYTFAEIPDMSPSVLEAWEEAILDSEQKKWDDTHAPGECQLFLEKQLTFSEMLATYGEDSEF